MEAQTGQSTKRCPSCGGQIVYDPGKGKLRCANCGTEPEMEQATRSVREHRFEDITHAAAGSAWDGAVRVLKCPACGAEVSAEAHVTGTHCRYCGTALQVESGRSAGVPPEAVAPFTLQKHEALSVFTKWVKARFFAPNALKSLCQRGQLTAMYLPYWTFDAKATGEYTGEGGRKHTRTVTKDGKSQEEVEWTWHRVSGTVHRDFDDILVYAGAQKGHIAGRLARFDLGKTLVPFSKDYLQGFTAETYTVSPEEGKAEAERVIEDKLRSDAESSIKTHYDDARSVRVTVYCRDVMCKHILLPVWDTGYSYKGKYYNVMINGVSGEIKGEYPKSAVKITLTVLLCLAVIAALVLVYNKYMG